MVVERNNDNNNEGEQQVGELRTLVTQLQQELEQLRAPQPAKKKAGAAQSSPTRQKKK